MKDFVAPRAMRTLYVLWLNVAFLRPLLDKIMIRTFDRLAADWDARTAAPGRLDPLAVALSRLHHAPARTLEMGCGTADASLLLGERFPSAWLVAIDISSEMLDAAQTNAREAGAAIQFFESPNYQTGFDDESFDLVVLVNVPPPFGEIERLLTPHGHAIIVFTKGSDTWFYSRPSRLKRGFASVGMVEEQCGQEGAGEYFVAKLGAVPVRSGVDPKTKKNARVAEVPR
ncbi:MAG: class I SAM-dependent methyltransferase [Thermoleophilaceae bacterium]|nr:class I SAM-dependent methyltransferase [Thermoleophilaceae bacterium]